MLENIQNVLNVPEFRKRAVFTLIMFIVFRLGVHIPVPGVDSSVIENLFSSGNLFGLLDLFAGGALSKFSVLAMSITPYINASIIMQLLTAVVPTFEQWAKDNQEGRDKIQKVTRYGTVVLALIHFRHELCAESQQCPHRRQLGHGRHGLPGPHGRHMFPHVAR